MTDRDAQVDPNDVPFIIKFSVMYYKSRPNHTAKPTLERNTNKSQPVSFGSGWLIN